MSTYWQSFDLESDPFTSEQAIVSYYESPQWKQTLDLLLHLSQNSKAVLLVTGLSGVGKTTLSRQFIEKIGSRVDICKIQGDASIEPDVLRYLLARHLSLRLSDGGKEEFDNQLQRRLEEMRVNNQKYFLLIDDAHKIPERTLASILDIISAQEEQDAPLHALFFGGPQLEAIVAEITSQHLGEGMTHTTKIKPLNQELCEAYILHRLSVAGWKGELPFSEQEFSEIHQSAEGIPRKINLHAQQFLAEKSGTSAVKKNKQRKDRQTASRQGNPYKFWLALGGVTLSFLFVLVAGFVIRQWTSVGKNNHNVVEQVMRKIEEQTAESTEVYNLGKTVQHEEKSFALDAGFSAPKIQLSSGPQFVQPQPFSAPVMVDKPQFLEPVKETLVTVSSEVPAVSEVVTAPATPAELDQRLAEIVTKQEPQPKIDVKKQPLPAAVVAAEKTEVDSVLLMSNQMIDVSDPDVRDSTEAFEHKVTQPNIPIRGLTSAVQVKETNLQQILAKDAKHYTLQLMASRDKAPLEKFVHQSGLDNKVSYFHSYLHGKDWYVVIYGDYATRAQALDGSKQLAKKVQQQQPWARSFASIHKVIRVENQRG